MRIGCLRPCEAEIRLYFESVVCSASASPQGLSKIEREGNREETECWKAADVTLQCTRGDPKTVRQREETDPLWANAKPSLDKFSLTSGVEEVITPII
jgi:hypothetical protein